MHFNTLIPGKISRQFAEDISKCIFYDVDSYFCFKCKWNLSMFYVEKDILVGVELLMYQAWMVTSSGSCTYCIQYTPMKGNLVNLQSIQNQRNNGSDCGLTLNQWQAIIWTNNVPWRTIWRLIEPSLSRLFTMLRSLSCLGVWTGLCGRQPIQTSLGGLIRII